MHVIEHLFYDNIQDDEKQQYAWLSHFLEKMATQT